LPPQDGAVWCGIDLQTHNAALIACPPRPRFDGAMPDDPFIREKFTKERSAARKTIREYFKRRYPNKQFQTELESWRHLQSQNVEFTMKRLREPIERTTGDR
jgi:hypothetical protein